MNEVAEEKEGMERRQYFRAAGIVYMHLRRPEEGPVAGVLAPAPRGSLDAIAVKLMHFRSRIEYNQPENHAYFLELADVIGLFHKALLECGTSLDQLPKVKKRSVIISGSGLEFVTGESYQSGEKYLLEMTFPDYPYATVILNSDVVRVEPFGSTPDRYRVCLAYRDINETDRELIIKYVNHLQRKKAAQSIKPK